MLLMLTAADALQRPASIIHQGIKNRLSIISNTGYFAPSQHTIEPDELFSEEHTQKKNSGKIFIQTEAKLEKGFCCSDRSEESGCLT